MNEFPDEAIPEPIQIILVARWLQGAASIEWLMEHPIWYEWADITQLGYEEGMAERRRLEAPSVTA